MTLPAEMPLRDAIGRQLAARMGATTTLFLVFGEDPDLQAIVDWVLYDPHNPPAGEEFVAALDRETQHLLDFDAALLGAMTWDDPGGGWA